ncbi:MAG: C1 family peptidase [candidate division KSB1 bacterium]|nr:C1 family peptidase [candidate division KSB1 bacterium]
MRRILCVVFVLLVAWGVLLGQQISRAQVEAQLQRLQAELATGRYSFTVGHNPALNFSLEQLCGLREAPDWRKTARQRSLATLRPAVVRALEAPTALPSSWDWRQHNGVTPVRDQDGCGSCWAFATVASLESVLMIKQALSTDLSEQYLVSCNTSGWGCNGGWWAHDMLVNPGAVLEQDFPYVASDVPCGGPYNYPYKLTGWAYVTGEDAIPAVEALKKAIYDYGPACAAVYVGPFFQAYTGGVFDKDEAPKGGLLSCCPAPAKVNHAIFIIGWDDSKGAWLLKNSWGPGWGETCGYGSEGGYMWIKYGISNVGYAAAVAW